MNPQQATIKDFMEQLELLSTTERIEVLIEVHKLLMTLALQAGKAEQIPLPFSDYNLEEVYRHFMSVSAPSKDDRKSNWVIYREDGECEHRRNMTWHEAHNVRYVSHVTDCLEELQPSLCWNESNKCWEKITDSTKRVLVEDTSWYDPFDDPLA